MKALIKKYLFNLAINPFTYIFAAALNIFCALKFFIGQQFFSGYGSTDLHYFFASIPTGCILFIPATVSFLSENKNELSLPFSDIKIIVSKYISSLFISGIFLLLSFAVPVTVSFFGNLDYSQIFCGYFGILLYLIFSYSITFFIFSLIKSKGAGTVISAIILLIFTSAHSLALYVNLPIGFSALTKTISFSWHFDSFAKGILDSRDILFFVILSFFFMAANYFVIERKRGNSSRFLFHTKIISFLTSAVLLVIISNAYFKIDTTSSKKYSVSKYSKILLNEVTDKLYINYYVSPELKKLYPQIKDVNDFLEAYSSVSKNIIYSQQNAGKPSVQKQLVLQEIPYQQLETSSANKGSYTNVYSAVSLNYLGKTQIIPFALSTNTLEYDLDLRLLSLVRNVEHNIQLLTGNNLSLDEDYSYVEPWLKSMGINIKKLSLPLNYSKLDQSMPLVILGTENFSKEDCHNFENFILSGGKAFVATQPYTVDLKNDWSVTESNYAFTRQLFTFGMYFDEALSADISNFQLALYSDKTASGNSAVPQTEYINYSLWPVLNSQTNAKNGMTLFWPCGISIDNEIAEMVNMEVIPYLVSSPQSWQIKKIDDEYITNPFAAQKYPDNKSEFKTSYFAAAAYRKNSSSPVLILTGDQYAFSTGMINYSSSQTVDTRSLEYLTDSIFTLNGEEKLVEVKNKTSFDFSLNKIAESDFYNKAIDGLIWNIMLPLIFYAAVFAFVFVKRRRFNYEKA